MGSPDCYKCVFRLAIPGDAHSSCANLIAAVKGDPIGIRGGWFFWPLTFDPVWLRSCDGFSPKNAEDK
jgi:hypothetical protein